MQSPWVRILQEKEPKLPHHLLKSCINNDKHTFGRVLRRHWQFNSGNKPIQLFGNNIWSLRFLAVQVPKAFIDSIEGFFIESNLGTVQQQGSQHLISKQVGITYYLSESLIVGLLHYPHLIQHQGLVQSLQKVFKSLPDLKMNFLCLHFRVDIEKEEILNYFWTQNVDFFLPILTDCMEAYHKLTEQSSNCSNAGLSLKHSIYLHNVLGQHMFSVFISLSSSDKGGINLLFQLL